MRLRDAISVWLDSSNLPATPGGVVRRVDWIRILPFLGMHVACLAVLWVGWSPTAVWVALALYLTRMFAITGFYHRYFSHRAYRTSRPAQFLFALAGNSAVQRGPLWWAAHHRHHHRVSDHEGDPHSPHVNGFWWSHLGWLTDPANFPTDLSRVPDLARFRELRWLDRYDTLVPLAVMGGTFGLGALLERFAPGLGTNGWQMFVWGFFVSTVLLFHATCLVNSAAHLIGRRRFETSDGSRNSLIVALLTMGEGWHNNHHHYCASTRQGFLWWEIDATYYLLRGLQAVGIVWDIREPPAHIVNGTIEARAAQREAA